ncbi:MAG TPA: xanthine dehydrogenase family protein molybdopterin-binding subunit [Paracoccaceae bacterium]|nr:xanthine dehydrogenase family protein molybdopterin-binding subunit [Paracoccaceae bacterium]
MLHHLIAPLGRSLRTSRRGFLMAMGGAGAGLILGSAMPMGRGARAATAGAFNPFVRVAPDGTVTVIVKHLDMGQGIATGLATLVAEEMDVAVEQVTTEFAPANDADYKNLFFGMQGTGGSTGIANSWEQYRAAGAAARAMLVEAAAAAWGVPAAEIQVANGRLRHPSGKEDGFGAFADAAAALTPPEKPRLKAPEEWVYIGKEFRRVDALDKSTGAIQAFALDLHLDDMLTVVVARPPKWGSTVAAVDDAAARAVKGVADVISGPFGVAVIAEKTWPAIKARDLLDITWDEAQAETRGTAEIEAEYRALLGQPGAVAREDGNADEALSGAAQVVEAEYVFPFLAHAPMEPLDTTILYDGQSATVWTGSQMQTVDQAVAAGVLGLAQDKVQVVTRWAGGSFGRRATANSHYVAEAALIAKAWGKAQPLKVVWTREDDLKGGYYRPFYLHSVRAGLDAEGRVIAWKHRVVGQSIIAGTPFEPFIMKHGIDETSVEGLTDATYALGAVRVELHSPRLGVPVLWWRSVGHTHTAYAMETMIDQLAKAAGKDPVAFRLELLEGDARKTGVLKLAAEKAGWDKPPAPGRFRGVAVQKSFNSYVAEVAEISYADGNVKVEKVVCAVDCGVAVNPDNIRAQMEGGIGFGLGAVLRNQITLTAGAVDQANFDSYEPIRMSDMPEVEVHVVASAEPPTGVGEPGVPPVGPAVANAIFAATGRHPRRLPFTNADYV